MFQVSQNARDAAGLRVPVHFDREDLVRAQQQIWPLERLDDNRGIVLAGDADQRARVRRASPAASDTGRAADHGSARSHVTASGPTSPTMPFHRVSSKSEMMPFFGGGGSSVCASCEASRSACCIGVRQAACKDRSSDRRRAFARLFCQPLHINMAMRPSCAMSAASRNTVRLQMKLMRDACHPGV